MTLTNDLTALEPITEQVLDWRSDSLEIDADERVVRNVVLSGSVSRNGYQYSADALQQAASLYVRKPVFLDHAANVLRPLDRSTRDLVGTVLEARFEGGRIRGDIQVLDTEAGRTFLALMATDQPTVGMSHVVLAQRATDGKVVDRIHDVISVDAVVFPATTQGFHESTLNPVHDLTVLQEQLQQSRTEIDRLQLELHRRDAALEVETLLTAAGLPDFAVTSLFREQLQQATDTARRQQLIQERRQLVQRTESGSILSRPRQMFRADTQDQALIRAIKGGHR